jgi:hypothetical protein
MGGGGGAATTMGGGGRVGVLAGGRVLRAQAIPPVGTVFRERRKGIDLWQI